MSVPVPVEELGEAVGRFGAATFLLTTGDDLRPHATSVRVEMVGEQLRCGLGRRTARNATERPKISLLWPPTEPGGYSLIVDGDIAVSGTPGEDAVGLVTVSNAVQHRPAEAGGSDCRPVGLPE